MKRIDGIDITRGLLALSVAIYHYIQFLDIRSLKKIHPFITAGITCVDGFFMISGFALFYSYHKVDFTQAKNINAYFYKRFARIAPLFYLCMLLNVVPEPMVLILVALLFLIGYGGERRHFQFAKYSFLLITLVLVMLCFAPWANSYDRKMMLNNFFFTFGFVNPNMTEVRGGWSIGIEYIFYFALPFILCLAKNSVKYLIAISLFTVFLAVDHQLLTHTNLYEYHPAEYTQEVVNNWPHYTNPFNHFYFFMAGILLFILYEQYNEVLVSKQQWLIKIMLGLCVAYCFMDKITGQASYGYGRFFYSILTVLIISLTPFIRIKDNLLKKGLIALGDMSYSVYLMQFPVYSVVIYLTDKLGIFNTFQIFVIALLCLLFVSYFTYRLYELPAKTWLIHRKSAVDERRPALAVPQ